MMSLALVKNHLRIFIDSEDGLLEQYISAAKSYVERHCDIEVVYSLEPGQVLTERQVLYAPDIQQAMLQLIGFWYVNREAQAFGSVSQDAMNIVDRILWTRKRF